MPDARIARFSMVACPIHAVVLRRSACVLVRHVLPRVLNCHCLCYDFRGNCVLRLAQKYASQSANAIDVVPVRGRSVDGI